MSTANTLRQYHLTNAFEDVDLLIKKTVHQFIRRYGGNYDELIGRANELFILAFDEFKEGQSRFSTFVRWVVGKACKKTCARPCVAVTWWVSRT